MTSERERAEFRFRHSTEWGKDLEIMRRAGPVRWTDEQLDKLKLMLNSQVLAIVSDAIGSLRFDKIEAEAALREERKRTIEQLAPYLEDQFRHIAEEWLKALDKETA